MGVGHGKKLKKKKKEMKKMKEINWKYSCKITA